MKLLPTLFLLLSPLPGLTLASEVACPDLTRAVRAGNCPSEDELLLTFNGFCSDNARIYGKGAELCTDYRAYREKKNIVLWESADGGFQSYVSCELPEANLRAMRPQAISTAKDRVERGESGERAGKGMGRLICTYGEGVSFTRRTREECRIETAEACKTDVTACRAECKAE